MKDRTLNDISIIKKSLPWSVFALGIAMELIIGSAGLLWAYFDNKNLLFQLISQTWIADMLLGAATGVTAALLLWLLIKFIRTLQKSRSLKIIEFLRNASLLQAILLSLAAGIGEEFLFRGAMQPAFGLWITSILFGLLHPYSRLYIITAILAGLGLGYLYQETGSLMIVITAHACYDFTILALLIKGKFPQAHEPGFSDYNQTIAGT